ncbi:MAG: imelysin family protein [Shimia sp.]
MIARFLMVLALCTSAPAMAQTPDIDGIVDGHVLPRYERLAQETASLAEVASRDCAPESAALHAAYHAAFDAWIGVSHLRFGPSEVDDRAFALAFWPDPRGSTPRTLAALIAEEDPVIRSPDTFATVSVAGRGFHALEFLLFDPQFTDPGPGTAAYTCALIRAVTGDMATNAADILADWRGSYADLMRDAGNDTFRTPREAAQQLFTALTTGLEFTSEMRLGRPLGTFERPRPARAEARRSERSQRNVVLALEATDDLALRLAEGDATVAADFDAALAQARGLDDPVFAGVANPGGRFRVETLQQRVTTARRTLLEDIGPRLGITSGFNSLDGD